MLELIDRIRKFDYRKLKPWQIVVGVAGVVVAIWILGMIVSLLTTLVPIALGVVALFFAYRWLSSRSEELPEEATKSKAQKDVDEALATVAAAESNEYSIEVEGPEAFADAEFDEKLAVKQIVNPETGFKEPDISRLIEREQEKLKEADKMTDDIMSQLEARRKRLLGDD